MYSRVRIIITRHQIFKNGSSTLNVYHNLLIFFLNVKILIITSDINIQYLFNYNFKAKSLNENLHLTKVIIKLWSSERRKYKSLIDVVYHKLPACIHFRKFK